MVLDSHAQHGEEKTCHPPNLGYLDIPTKHGAFGNANVLSLAFRETAALNRVSITLRSRRTNRHSQKGSHGGHIDAKPSTRLPTVLG